MILNLFNFQPCVGTFERSPKKLPSCIWCSKKWICISTYSICRWLYGMIKTLLNKPWIYSFDYYSVCAGLWVNLDKTEAIWVDSGLGSDKQLLPEKQLAWNTSGKFILLGIHFNLYKRDKAFETFSEKIKKKCKDYLKLMGIQGFKLY